MIDRAWDWAAKHGKLRENEIHGEEEAKLILDDTFSFKSASGSTETQEKNVVVEVPRLQYQFASFTFSLLMIFHVSHTTFIK